ncbi:hypothetical protein [Microbacterium sp. 1P10AE]|uniref:hypothetical protein n=1 Tax=Microbacterium sp. 1P10AE TaxID=3132286 RepID=UPI0039A27AF5
MIPENRGSDRFESPIAPEWTLLDLCEWIGADDGRCHDPRLNALLAAVERALAPERTGAVSTVVLVRSIAARLVAEPHLGGLRLGSALDVPAPSAREVDRTRVPSDRATIAA